MSTGIVCGGLLALCVSCTEYTPKPRGYFRIEPPAPSYQALPVGDLPYTFRLSRWAEVELLRSGIRQGGSISLIRSLNVKLYCSYFPITPATLGRAEEECRALVVRQSKYPERIKMQAYSNPEAFGLWFAFHAGLANPLSPLQFMLTVRVSCIFSGELCIMIVSRMQIRWLPSPDI